MNLILSGLPKSGKTTIGRKLADQLGWKFVDTDELIIRSYEKAKSCREIFLNKGEAFFRELEREQILSLVDLQNHVIALGGGTLMCENNRECIKNLGKVIYLKCDLRIIVKRMEASGKPGYIVDLHDGLRELAERRIPVYEATADWIVDVAGLNPDETVSHLLNNWNKQDLHQNFYREEKEEC